MVVTHKKLAYIPSKRIFYEKSNIISLQPYFYDNYVFYLVPKYNSSIVYKVFQDLP